MAENYSLSDIQAATNGGFGGFGGSEGMWIFALLILMFGGGGFGLNRDSGLAQTDLNLLNAVQNGQRDIEARVQEVGAEAISATKDSAYNNLSEIRNIGDAVAVGFSNMQSCCCETQRAIDSAKYDNAIGVASVNANIDNKFAALEKSMLEQRLAEQSQQISQLQLSQALCGVPKINNYAWGTYPYNNAGCGCGNI